MLRRSLAVAPRLTRGCAFQAKVKDMETKSVALAAKLPAGLKEIAEQGTSITAELSKFASERPELYKAVLAAIEEADKPGISPTVAVAKDPKACKYTEEGTMVHEMMQRVAAADRRMKVIGSLEVSLTAASAGTTAAAAGAPPSADGARCEWFGIRAANHPAASAAPRRLQHPSLLLC